MSRCFAILAALAGALLLAMVPAKAQLSVDVSGVGTTDLVIAVPGLATPVAANTAAGSTDALGRQIAEVIVTDLRNSGLFRPIGPSAVRPITFGEVTSPAFDYWPDRRCRAGPGVRPRQSGRQADHRLLSV